MPTPPSVSLHGERYELSRPIDVAGVTWRIVASPVTAITFSRFLNETGHVEPAEGPHYINVVNYDTPLRYSRHSWEPRPGHAALPVTLITYRGAQKFAEYHELALIDTELWRVLRQQDVPPAAAAVDVREINIEDSYGGPLPAGQLAPSALGIRGLYGNISFWGTDASGTRCHSYAPCFGVGWNKSRINLMGDMVKYRWTRIASVSTGIRLACRQT